MLAVACLGLISHLALAADDRQSQVLSHVQAIEASAQLEPGQLANHYAGRFSADFLQSTPAADRLQLLQDIQQALRQAGAILLSERGPTTVMSLQGAERWDLLISVQIQPPYAIAKLELQPATPLEGVKLDPDPAAALQKLADNQGFAGVVWIKRDGKPEMRQAFGMANADLGYPNQVDTIFGIGSTPIDFTIASIALLVEDGVLSTEAPIGRYFPDAPADKAALTVGHLLNGESGLPDFFHRQDEWDADLAWVDRDSAVQRILQSPLSFAPGSGQAHSHAAFVLLAALVETVSGSTYSEFLQQRIFEPAGMVRTGFYGSAASAALRDFAVGAGPNRVGIPNIPPNWGPTSWLIMGSGGMYSTLDDMHAFYRYTRSVLQGPLLERYHQPTIDIGGSDRGFYYFHVYDGGDNEAILLSNGDGHGALLQSVSDGLRMLVENAGTAAK